MVMYICNANMIYIYTYICYMHLAMLPLPTTMENNKRLLFLILVAFTCHWYWNGEHPTIPVFSGGNARNFATT